MKQQLSKKQVTVKLAGTTASFSGNVYEVENNGLWLQPSTAVQELPANVKHPLMFVPYSQMSWLAVPMTAEQLTGHRA